jgi:HEAT repeat protein
LTLNDNSLLLRYQREKNGKIRKKILESGKLKEMETKVSLFIEALGDPDIDNKVFAISVLGELATPEAIKPLIELTQYRLEIKKELLSAIVKIVEKCDLHEIMPTLLEFDNLNVKKSLPLILGRLSTKESKEYLMEFLSDQNPIVRKNAVKALRNKLEPSDIEHIIGLVDDENLNVKIHTMGVLGQIGNRSAIKSLIENLNDENEVIRSATVRAFYKILKREDILKPLYSILAKRNKFARREAVRLLGMLKKPDALKKLIRLLNSRDNKIRRIASIAIVKILRVNPDYIYLIRESLNANEWQLRRYSAKILGQINDKESIEILLQKINDSKSLVRRAAVNDIGKN